jgi:curved DNA-binding protein
VNDAGDHYATLGLDRDCSAAQIRAAYRSLAKRHHPDVNQNAAGARARTEALNAAHEILGNPARRRAYDRELDRASQATAPARGAPIVNDITQDVHLRIEDFLRGTSLRVEVNDPAHPDGVESYPVNIPALTAPGSRLRLPRTGASAKGVVILRLKTLPGFRYKVRGSDLRTDLRLSPQRAAEGGSEAIERPTGGMLRLTIPARAKRGEILRVPGEGLPKPRGGRGDLLVRLTYRPGVRVSRLR